jgi:hypothetical protein
MTGDRWPSAWGLGYAAGALVLLGVVRGQAAR